LGIGGIRSPEVNEVQLVEMNSSQLVHWVIKSISDNSTTSPASIRPWRCQGAPSAYGFGTSPRQLPRRLFSDFILTAYERNMERK